MTTTTSEKPKGIAKIFRKAVEQPDERVPPRARGEKVSNVELCNLRELIRQRYALDLEIWGYRKVGTYNHAIIEDKMRKSDALLGRIRAVVLSMDHRDHFRTEAEFAKFQDVKTRVLAGGKRQWENNPPWHED